jgi:hypothetical protein
MTKNVREDWLANGLLVFGALGTVVGIGGWLTQDLTLLLAFVAGGGWLLSIPLLVIVRKTSAELSDLRHQSETEVIDLRQQIAEWRTIATQDSDSLNRFVARAVEMPTVLPRRPQHAEAANTAHVSDDEVSE